MKARFPTSLLAAFVLLNASVCFAANSVSGAWSSKFPTPPSANAPVHAFATIGTNFYVGGQFTEIAGIHARCIARFDGQNWFEVGGGISGDGWANVQALCAEGTNLYVGGNFTQVGGLTATNIAKWSGDHWESLGDGATILGFANIMPAVEALYFQGSNLYVGGRFDYANGVRATNIARWDGAHWFSLGNGVSLPRPSDPHTAADLGHVSALTGDGTNIYVGGQFVSAGSLQTTNLARWDGSEWQTMGATFDNGVTGIGDPVVWNNVRSLAWHKSLLYVGGDFQTISGQPGIGLARWDGSIWQAPALLEGGDLPVIKNILSVGDKLYVAGKFDRVNGQSSPNAFILQGDVVTPLNCPMYLNIYGGTFALGAFNGRIFFGGDFWTDDLAIGANFVEITDGGLKPLVALIGAEAPNYSRAIATDGTNIFVAGDYSYVAKWDGAKWSTPAPAIIPNWGMNHLATIGSNVFLAGNFSSAALGVTNFARWDGQNWKPVGTASTMTLDSMLALGSKLYVTGTFSDTATSCKWWDGTNWTRVAWFPQTFNTAQRLATDGTNIFIAREDPNAGQPMVRVARWNGSTVFQLPNNVPLPHLSAIAATASGEIWVAGSKSTDPYYNNNCLYRWTDAGWAEWPNATDAGTDIRVMSGFGQYVVAAGSFKTFAGFVANSIAAWDGTSWRPMDGGLTGFDEPASVASLAVSGNRLLVTGEFDMAGRTSSGNIAMWTAASNIQLKATPTASGVFQVSGGIGDRAEIEASDSLVNWTKIAELQFLSPTQQFTDPAPSTSATRFYRAKIVEP